MEQKLYVVEISCIGEMLFPQDLQELLNTGWRIAQISAYSCSTGHGSESCVLLLQK